MENFEKIINFIYSCGIIIIIVNVATTICFFVACKNISKNTKKSSEIINELHVIQRNQQAIYNAIKQIPKDEKKSSEEKQKNESKKMQNANPDWIR